MKGAEAAICHLRDCVSAAARLKNPPAPHSPAASAALPLLLQGLRAADWSESWLAPTLALKLFSRSPTSVLTVGGAQASLPVPAGIKAQLRDGVCASGP